MAATPPSCDWRRAHNPARRSARYALHIARQLRPAGQRSGPWHHDLRDRLGLGGAGGRKVPSSSSCSPKPAVPSSTRPTSTPTARPSRSSATCWRPTEITSSSGPSTRSTSATATSTPAAITARAWFRHLRHRPGCRRHRRRAGTHLLRRRTRLATRPGQCHPDPRRADRPATRRQPHLPGRQPAA